MVNLKTPAKCNNCGHTWETTRSCVTYCPECGTAHHFDSSPETITPTMDDLLCIRRHGHVPRFDPDTGQAIPEDQREALTKAALEQGLAQEVAGRLVLTRKGSSALFLPGLV